MKMTQNCVKVMVNSFILAGLSFPYTWLQANIIEKGITHVDEYIFISLLRHEHKRKKNGQYNLYPERKVLPGRYITARGIEYVQEELPVSDTMNILMISLNPPHVLSIKK